MKTCVTLIFLFTYGQIWCQNQANDLHSEDELIAYFDYFYNNPLDLNSCSREELNQIQFLTINQINSFIEYRKHQGTLLHLFELQVIPDWDLRTCRKIAQLVFVQSATEQKLSLKNNFILFRLEETMQMAQGFKVSGKSSSYQGNRLKEFIKLKNNPAPFIKLGLITQKDAGESNEFDFISGYLDITPRKGFQKLILGDYSVQWGQGLLQAGGFNLGKNHESIKATQKFHLGGIPYSSSGESSFNRGIYLSKVLHSKLNIQTFYSNKYLDGKLYSINDQIGFKSINTDGYHRNTSELNNKQTIHEIKFGNSLQFNITSQSNLQLNAILTRYSPQKIPSGIDYKLNEWNGNQFLLWSISHSSTIKNKRIINELAFEKNNTFSLIHGLAISLSKKQDLSYLFRYFSSGFYNPDGKALGESTKNENEIGLFLGHQFQLTKRKKISSYLDLFYFPEIKYQVSFARSFGWEFLNRYQMERKNAYRFFNQLKWTSKEEDLNLGKNEKKKQRIHDLQESIDLNFINHKWIQWHNRLIIHWVEKDLSSYLGIMYLQDVNFSFQKLQLKGRIAYIHSPNYDTRLYAFEPGLPYSFNLIAYSGQAVRLATTIELPVIKTLSFSMKIGHIFYIDKNEIGSGTDLIQGNQKTDLSLQIVFKNL